MGRAAALRIAIFAALALAGVAAPAAGAGGWTTTPAPCTSSFQQSFLPWADPMWYVPAPAGDLESTSGWTLAGGARLVSGNEPFYVTGDTADRRSLALPAGSSATTRPMCVTIEYPTIRFLAVNSGSLLSSLDVDVLYEDWVGQIRSMRIGTILAGGSWAPTPPLTFSLSGLTSWVANGSSAAVAFRFTARGSGGGWRIDDVLVDPFRSR